MNDSLAFMILFASRRSYLFSPSFYPRVNRNERRRRGEKKEAQFCRQRTMSRCFAGVFLHVHRGHWLVSCAIRV